MRKATCASSPTLFTVNQGTWRTKTPLQTASPRARFWNGAIRSTLHSFRKMTTTARRDRATAVKKTRSWGNGGCCVALWLLYATKCFMNRLCDTQGDSFLCCHLCSYNRDEVQQQAEVLCFSLEKGNMVPQIKHNPWSLKCHQQHLQRMKENAKHRNQYSILLLLGMQRRGPDWLNVNISMYSLCATFFIILDSMLQNLSFWRTWHGVTQSHVS